MRQQAPTPEFSALWFDLNLKKLRKVNQEIDELYVTRRELLYNLSLVAEQFKRLRDSVPDLKLPKLEIPPELAKNPRYAPTLGSAIEAVLKEHGNLRQIEIFKYLAHGGVRMSEKNPFIVLSNEIRRNNRFKIFEDGTVGINPNSTAERLRKHLREKK